MPLPPSQHSHSRTQAPPPPRGTPYPTVPAPQNRGESNPEKAPVAPPPLRLEGIFSRSLQDFITDTPPPKKNNKPFLALPCWPGSLRIVGSLDQGLGPGSSKTIASTSLSVEWGNSYGSPLHYLPTPVSMETPAQPRGRLSWIVLNKSHLAKREGGREGDRAGQGWGTKVGSGGELSRREGRGQREL